MRRVRLLGVLAGVAAIVGAAVGAWWGDPTVGVGAALGTFIVLMIFTL